MMLRFGLSILIFLANFSFAQSKLFDRIDIMNGLAQNSVYSIYQDNSGYIWAGTEEGLNRFDGFNFEIFRYKPKSTMSLSSSYITKIVGGKDNDLWIGTFSGGINKFNRKTQISKRFTAGKDDFSVSESQIKDLILDGDSLYIATANVGINILDIKTNKIYKFIKPVLNDLDCEVNAIALIKFNIDKQLKSFLLIGTSINGLFYFDIANKSYGNLNLDINNKEYLEINAFYSPAIDSNFSYISIEGIGLYKVYFNLSDSGKLEIKQIVDQKICSISNARIEDIDVIYGNEEFIPNELLLGTRNHGLINYNYSNKKCSSIKVDASIHSIFIDKGGLLWLGTDSKGLLKEIQYKKKINSISSFTKEPFKLNDEFIWAINEDSQNNLWVGTNSDGLYKIDKKQNKRIIYRTNAVNPNSINSNSITYICEEPNSKGEVFWIGTLNAGFAKLDVKKNIFVRFNTFSGLSHNSVRVIQRDKRDTTKYWIATAGGGLNKFNSITGEFKHYSNDPQNPNSISNNFLWALHIDDEGIIWIGSRSGLIRMDPVKESFKNYIYDPFNPNSLSHNSVLSVNETSDGKIWLGTFGGGLNYFDKKNERFSNISMDEGLPNNVVYGVLEDDKKNLWFGTNRGLVKIINDESFDRLIPRFNLFNNYNKIIQKFEMVDGLINLEYNVGAYFKGPSGTLYFGGINGIDYFKPDDININLESPHIGFTYLSKHNAKGEIEKISLDNDEITLSYKDYLIEFHLTSFDYKAPFKVEFAYQLEGSDLTWNYLGNQKTITFTKINPGEYTLYVIAANSDGLWNKEGISLKLNIPPPIWQTFIFRFFIGALIAVLITLAVIRKINNIKKKNASLRQHNLELEQEISKRKKAQIESEKNQKRFFELSNLLPLTVFEIDRDFNILFLNQTGRYLLGYSHDEIVKSKSIYDFFIQEEKEILQNEFLNILTYGGTVTVEISCRTKSGSHIPVTLIAEEMLDTNLKIDGIRGVLVDMTQIREAQIALQKSEIKYRNLFDFSADAILILDRTQIVDANEKAAELFKLPKNDLLRKSMSNFIFEFDKTNTKYIEILDLVYNGNSRFLELELTKSDESIFPAIVHLTPIDIGSERFIQAIVRDITIQKETESTLVRAKEEAQKADRFKSEFLAQISHEIRTPIGSILNNCELLEFEIKSLLNEELKEIFISIGNSGSRIIRTIELILYVAEIQSHSYEYTFETFDLIEEIVNNEYLKFKPKFDRKNLQFIIERDIEKASIFADKISTSRVFENLLENALKFTNQGEVSVKIFRNENGLVQADIIDSGVGMSENFLDQIFKYFSQEESGYTRKFDGSGLGMALVKGYCDLNKFNISVKSTKGKGTNFSIVFPNQSN